MAAARIDLSCELSGIHLNNPTVLASGILGTSADLMERAAQSGAGCVTAKSCGPGKRAGHPNPVAVEWEGGVINAIGLTNPGADEEVPLLREAKHRLASMGVPLFASIFAPTVAEFAQVAAIISQAEPDLIEINISCPNVGDEFGTPFAGSPETAAQVTAAVKAATHIAISVKLAPNVPNIARIAHAVVEAGADAITAINTMPGLIIDPKASRPVLANRVGGLSGWSLKPVALRCVAEIRQAVDVPIIGTGGVANGLDAAEMIMAGADAVGVGTAVWQRGPQVFNLICDELIAFMEDAGYPDLQSMKGAALR
jgi:dihydroorotate dehydrogenase (NAD+) catalytic subunit